MRHLTVQQLSASLDGALVGVSLELVVRHLATCRECRARHARLSKQDETLRHLLAWDPGAEYFEDASIRLETILDAESRGVAPPRISEIEAHLPRVTIDDVLRSAQAASVTPISEPTPPHRPGPPLLPLLESVVKPHVPEPASPPPARVESTAAAKPAMQFPAWMQPTTDRPVTPRPAPREPRPATPPIVPVVLARKEPPVIVPLITPEPAPDPEVEVAPVAPIMPVAPITPAAPVPEPVVELAPPVATPVLAPATSPAPALASVPAAPRVVAPRVVAPRPAIPRWVRPLVFTAAGLTALLAMLSALPPVIRIPEPQLPRLPRIELVKRQPRPTRDVAQPAAAPQPIASTPTASVVPPVAVTSIPIAIEPTMPTPEPREVTVHEAPHAAQAITPPIAPPVAPPVARQIAPPIAQAIAPPVARRPSPTRPAPTTITPIAPAPTPRKESPAATSDADPAADWPLLCGEVLDDTGTPVAGARVLLADLDLGARTDKRGRFCLAAPPGDRTLSVVALGFTAARQVVSLGTQTLEVRIALHPAP